MSKIEINNVFKIFGPKPASVLQMVKDGSSKEEVLEKTGHTVGLAGRPVFNLQQKGRQSL